MTPRRRALRGRRIILSPASAEDARPIYEWLACSDLTATMLGPPTYPELPVPTWEQFRADYLDHFFDGSSPVSWSHFSVARSRSSSGTFSSAATARIASG